MDQRSRTNLHRGAGRIRRSRRIDFAAAVGVGAMVVALAGPAIAAPPVNPVENGVITSCFKTTSGRSVRLVDPALPQTACKPNETALAWGQQGPAGKTGPQGDTGPQGAPGLAEFEVIPVSEAIPAAGGWIFEAACPDGKTAISGGYTLPGGSSVIESHPRDGDPTVWRLAFLVPGATTMKLYLQCARTQ
jgi:hypothetical protein